jgi:cation transport regulator ChaC
MTIAHVFGYASLVALPGTRPATLRGHRRVWGVAMDNSVAIPGYKVYESPEGARPPCSVAFLDLAPDEDATVDGALLAVDEDALAALDARERQYRRVDVTRWVTVAGELAADGPIWTFVGRGHGRARVAAGRAGDVAVIIQRAYVEHVERAFAALGEAALERYRASTEAPPFPVVELARVDLPFGQ